MSAMLSGTCEEADDGVGGCVEVSARSPGDEEGLGAHHPGGVGVSRVVQTRRQASELSQVDI